MEDGYALNARPPQMADVFRKQADSELQQAGLRREQIEQQMGALRAQLQDVDRTIRALQAGLQALDVEPTETGDPYAQGKRGFAGIGGPNATILGR